MGTIDLLDDIPVGAVIGLDTAPIIYLVEGHARFGSDVLRLFDERLEPGISFGVTSVVSLAEVLVRPIAAARNDLVERYRTLLTRAPHLSLVDLTPTIAEVATGLRARYRMRPPDALQVAAAPPRPR